ncbi:MAG: hypothetical protein ACC628_06765 [Pirellulaceae bacterium]
MVLDPYSVCPCGSGKKVKFCCSKDIVSELDKVMRAIEGEQRAAALDQINKLIKEKGEREALVALKANLQITLGDIEGAEPTIKTLAKISPHNPIALALTAVVEATKENTEAAVETLQQSLEYVDEHMPHAVYSAIGTVAHAMISSGNVLAARGHLTMQVALAGDHDSNPFTMLMRLNASNELPLLLKEDLIFGECPEEVPWRGEFSAAMKSARRGTWLAACESLSSLSEKVPDQPVIIRNIAILRGWLGQTDQVIEHWRQYARFDAVPIDDAVEAEALAQLLDKDQIHETVDQLTLTYPVTDMDRLMERLVSDRRVDTMPIDTQQLATEDAPPPRGAFYLLDRELPETGEGLPREGVPSVRGELYVYGKETNREARLEFALERLSNFDEHKAALAELAGELIGEVANEEVAGEVPALSAAMAWRWRLPDDTPQDHQKTLIEEQRREVMLQRWPDLPHSSLDGKPPREAASDPDYRLRTLAAILLLELAAEASSQGFDFNELRTELDLPTRDPIQSEEIDIRTGPMTRLAKLNTSTLADGDLILAFRRAILKHYRVAIYRFSQEIIRRKLEDPQLNFRDVYTAAIESCPDSNESLKFVEEAKNLAISKGESPAQWLLTELSIRLPRMEGEECNRLFQTLRSRHLKEPGVAQALHDLLVNFGLIQPDGPSAGPSEAAPGPPPAAPPDTGTAAPGELWTSDSAPPAGKGEGQSKLWVPGID